MAEKAEAKKSTKAKAKKKLKARFYSVKGDSLERLSKSCPKCGSGIYLANHKERVHCGKCGFTEWKK